MRQSHQKSRSRGRGRKPQNPLSRNYESNGPDVKIRGNAGHIAEKYSTLARDALSNGDTVMAENYFQHAEHYNRIVAAAQAQRAEEQQNQPNGRGPQPDVEEGGSDASGEDNAANATANGNADANGHAQEADAEQGEEAKPQKSGRGRRTRKAPVAADSNGSSDGEEAAQVGEDAPEPAVLEAISEDAAKLPESITGGMLGDDT